MAELSRYADGTLTGNIMSDILYSRHLGSAAGILTTQLAERSLRRHHVSLFDARVWDAVATYLPATGGSDDLGLYTGTASGTVANQIKTGDVKTVGCVRKARFLVPIPGDYIDGETLNIIATAGMETTVSDGATEVDINCYKVQVSGDVSVDLCATAAQSCKNLTAAEKSFSITSYDLEAGDMLDVMVTLTVVDAATVGAVIARLSALILEGDRRP